GAARTPPTGRQPLHTVPADHPRAAGDERVSHHAIHPRPTTAATAPAAARVMSRRRTRSFWDTKVDGVSPKACAGPAGADRQSGCTATKPCIDPRESRSTI